MLKLLKSWWNCTFRHTVDQEINATWHVHINTCKPFAQFWYCMAAGNTWSTASLSKMAHQANTVKLDFKKIQTRIGDRTQTRIKKDLERPRENMCRHKPCATQHWLNPYTHFSLHTHHLAPHPGSSALRGDTHHQRHIQSRPASLCRLVAVSDQCVMVWVCTCRTCLLKGLGSHGWPP